MHIHDLWISVLDFERQVFIEALDDIAKRYEKKIYGGGDFS
jgi:hypothetical protein